MELSYGGYTHPLSEAFVQAACEAGLGLGRTLGFNVGRNTEGVGLCVKQGAVTNKVRMWAHP